MSNTAIAASKVVTARGLQIIGGNAIQPLSNYKGYYNGTPIAYVTTGPTVYPTLVTYATNSNPTIVKNGNVGSYTIPPSGTGVWLFSSWVTTSAGAPTCNIYVKQFANGATQQNGNNNILFDVSASSQATFTGSSFLNAGDQIEITYGATANCNITVNNLSICQVSQSS